MIKNIENDSIIFSIIMPCYNSETYVCRAVESCINQTFENWELIAINDGSTDNTLNILNKYASEDNRIRVFSKENGGYVSAVNYGLEYVKGTYFMLLGSDDELTTYLLHEIYNNAIDSLPDFIGFRALINKNTSLSKDKNSDFENSAKEFDTSIKDFSLKYPQESKIFFTRDTAKLYKSELLGTLRYLGKKGMDADGIFSMMFSHKSSSFLCVPVDGYIWYLRDESLSGRRKDYITQVDRINNWIEFSEYLMTIAPSEITDVEKHYLTTYFFNVFRNVVFRYFNQCLKDDLIKRVQKHLNELTVNLNYKPSNKELTFFLKHSFLWSIFIKPSFLFDKLKKKMKI